MKIKIGQRWKCIKPFYEAVYEITKIMELYVEAIIPANPRISCIYLSKDFYKDTNEWIFLGDKIEEFPSCIGFSCSKCGDFNKYISQGNQADGSYKCYSCRN